MSKNRIIELTESILVGDALRGNDYGTNLKISECIWWQENRQNKMNRDAMNEDDAVAKLIF